MPPQIGDALQLQFVPPGLGWRDGGGAWTTPAVRAPHLGVRTGSGIAAGFPDTFILRRGIAHMIEIKAGEQLDPMGET